MRNCDVAIVVRIVKGSFWPIRRPRAVLQLVAELATGLFRSIMQGGCFPSGTANEPFRGARHRLKKSVQKYSNRLPRLETAHWFAACTWCRGIVWKRACYRLRIMRLYSQRHADARSLRKTYRCPVRLQPRFDYIIDRLRDLINDTFFIQVTFVKNEWHARGVRHLPT